MMVGTVGSSMTGFDTAVVGLKKKAEDSYLIGITAVGTVEVNKLAGCYT